MLCGRAEATEPGEVGTLHHAFLIHVGAEKAAAIGLEAAEHFPGGEIGRFAPAFHDDLAVFGIERDDNAFGSDGRDDFFESRSEGRSADDDSIGTLIDQPSRAVGSPHTAADSADSLRSDELDQGGIFTGAHGRVEIDHLDLREGGEFAQHFERRVAFEGFFAALNELDDLAVHEIDARNDHTRTWVPRAARYVFKSPTV